MSKINHLRFTVILGGELWATFADQFEALDFAKKLAKQRQPGSFVECFDTKPTLIPGTKAKGISRLANYATCYSAGNVPD